MSEMAMSTRSESANKLAPSPEAPVALALGRLSNTISDLDYSIEQMVNKLQPVLGPVQPTEPGDPSPKEEEASDITNILRREQARVQELVYTVGALLRRVEI